MEPSQERCMRKKLRSRVVALSVLAVCGALFGWGRAADQPEGDPQASFLLAKMQQKYDDTTDYAADFRQNTLYSTLQRQIQGRGEVYFSKPARMMWRYEEPGGQFLLADGKHLYFYQPEEEQIIKTALKQAFRSDLPLAFLLGLGNLRQEFHARIKEKRDNTYLLSLTPKNQTTGIAGLQLAVDDASYEIEQAIIEDAVGNRWTIEFSNIRRNVGLDSSFFKLHVPPGVDVVEFGS